MESGSFRQDRVAHSPFVPLAACGAVGADGVVPDAQQCADLALDAAVDFASGRRADKDEVLHDSLHRTTTTTSWAASLRQMLAHHVASVMAMQCQAMLSTSQGE